MPVKPNKKYIILAVIAFTVIVAIIMKGAILQDVKYHNFADNRNLYSIPNFWNVISNLPFFIIGLAGIIFMFYQKNKGNKIPLFVNCFVFFLGIFFTGIGSAYYHYAPANQTLVWDRLPMTISFMSFFSIIIGEYICEKSAKRILLPLLLIGLMSIIYWQMTESRGVGDLRFYAMVQFLPIVLIPLILVLFHSKEKNVIYYWIIIMAYGLAKFFEANDDLIYYYSFLSGHTIKHFFAACAPLMFLIKLKASEFSEA